MIFNIFGIADIIAALILYFGKIPGPSWLAKICFFVLIIKGLMSLFPLPQIFPFASPLGFVDVISAVLLFFGTAPALVPNILKVAVIIILAVKGLLSVLPELLKFIG